MRHARRLSLVIAILLAMPFVTGVAAGLHLRFSPYLMMQALVGSRLLSLWLLPGAAVLLIVTWRRRWFCRYVCPTGALCDAVAARRRKVSLVGWPRVNRFAVVTALGLAAAGLPLMACADPVALFTGFWASVLGEPGWATFLGVAGLAAVLASNLIVPRLWCARICPLGGLQEVAADVGERISRVPRADGDEFGGIGRRHVLAAACAAAGGVALGRLFAGRRRPHLRPPGARRELDFLAACCRCGRCRGACPAGIIVPELDITDPAGLMAPRVTFERSYCTPDCAACGAVCPTGAIRPFGVAGKPRLFIGTAVVRVEGCRLAEGMECDQCVRICAYDAIRIVTSDDMFAAAPEVVTERCVGCGACVVACPTGVVAVVPADGARPFKARAQSALAAPSAAASSQTMDIRASVIDR